MTKGWVRDAASISTCASGAGSVGSKTVIEGGKMALQTASSTADIPNCPHLKDINDLLATIISIYDDVMPLGVGNSSEWHCHCCDTGTSSPVAPHRRGWLCCLPQRVHRQCTSLHFSHGRAPKPHWSSEVVKLLYKLTLVNKTHQEGRAACNSADTR